jgi:ubiquinone/menaquinone biosynthesis C-methylase UbiE
LISWDDYWKTYSTSKAERWMIFERHKILTEYIDKINRDRKKVIEIGCGFGSNITLLSERRNDCDCYALDYSEESVKLVKERIPNTVLADCRDTGFENDFFDVVYSAGLMEHFRDEKPLLSEWKRILKPDGFLVTFIPARFSLWQLYQLIHLGNWQHGYEKSYTYGRLKKLMQENGFEIVDILGIDPFSLNGFIMKLLDKEFVPRRTKSFLKSGYTELCIITKK